MAKTLTPGVRRPAANSKGVLYAADRRKLERRARRLEADRVALREAMREAQARGASLREIAEVVGMSHAGVADWLRKHD